ncbi:MAG: hypothetical protein R2771_08905 [Saprospiraceae bacterium]
MKKIIFLFLALSAMAFTINAQNSKSKLVTIDVKDFDNQASKFVDQEIYITGTCDHVCKHAGRKLHLVGPNDSKVEVMASESIGKFPKELEGEDLKIKGTVLEDRIDEEYLKEWENEVKEHHKEGTPECENDMGKIKKMRKEMKTNNLGYVPVYYLEGISFEKI